MRIKQHIPGFCEGYEDLEAEFNSVEELKAIPWIARWSQEPDFRLFSIYGSQLSGDYLLIVEFSGSDPKWWTIGFLSEDIKALPRWQPTKKLEAP